MVRHNESEHAQEISTRGPVESSHGRVRGIHGWHFLATVRHFSHDHLGYTPDGLVAHFVPHLVATASVCALLFALAATILNRLMRKR